MATPITANSTNHSSPHVFSVSSSNIGLVNIIGIQNLDNTSGGSHANLNIATGGASSGDPSVSYNIGAITSWATRIHNADSDKYKLTTGAALTEVFVSTTAGEITEPLQPAFLAGLSATVNDVTGDGTLYTLIADSEKFDQNSDYNNATGTFTAPVTGRYWFGATVWSSGILVTHVLSAIQLNTSNRVYRGADGSPFAQMNSDTTLTYNSNWFADMDAGDTAQVQFLVAGGTKVIDLIGGGTNINSGFWGNLEC